MRRGNPNRLPSKRTPQVRRPERRYVNEDVYPQPLRKEVNVDEIVKEAQRKKNAARPRVAHDYNPFGNEDKMAQPDLKVQFIPSKHQLSGYDPITIKERPDIIMTKLGNKKVQPPQIYVMEGERNVVFYIMDKLKINIDRLQKALTEIDKEQEELYEDLNG